MFSRACGCAFNDIESHFQYASFSHEVHVIVCHCHRISERTVLDVVYSGALSTEEVGRACGAGTSCGGCRPTLDAIVEKACACNCGAGDCPRADESRRVA
jgi:bacterioferritin-associated ferredoxin